MQRPIVSAKPGERYYTYNNKVVYSYCRTEKLAESPAFVWRSVNTMIHDFYNAINVAREREIKKYLGYDAVFWRRDHRNVWVYVEDSRISEAFSAVCAKKSFVEVERILYL